MSSEAPRDYIPHPPDALPQGADNGVEGGHEDNRVQLSTTVWLTIASIAVVAVVHFGLLGGLKWADDMRKSDRVTAVFPGRDAISPDQFPQPRLEVRYDADIKLVLAEEKALTENYAWVDRKAGVARIPVNRAMDILAEKGLPKVAAPAPTAGAPPNTFVPVAGKREMAAPAVSTGESPAKAGAPPAVLPPGETPAGTVPKPGEPAKPADETKKKAAEETKKPAEETKKPADEPKKKESRS